MLTLDFPALYQKLQASGVVFLASSFALLWAELGIIRPALIGHPSCRSGIMAPVRYRGAPDGARQRRRRQWF
jgi:hypothetical protein